MVMSRCESDIQWFELIFLAPVSIILDVLSVGLE